MEQGIFKASFPSFPVDEESMVKLASLLKKEDLLSAEEWTTITTKITEPQSIVEKIATRDNISEIDLAKIEASILNVPFINLEETEIALEVIKLIKQEIIQKKKLIPINLSGQELLAGTLTPSDTSLITVLGDSNPLDIRLGKVISSQFDLKMEQFFGDEKEKKKKRKKKGPRKRLGDILVESKYLKADQLMQALKDAREAKLRMGAFLVKNGLITNKQLSIALSKQFGIPFVDLDESLVDPVLATLLPKKLCYEQIMCPVKREKGKLVLAMTDPTDIITIDHVEMMTGMRVSPVVSSELSIMASLGNLYGDSLEELTEGIGGSGGSDDDGIPDMGENDAPIIKLVNLILTQAIQLNVSDIHIEVYETELRIRFRLDGVLKLHMTPARGAHAGVVSRIKVMANLDIAETRRPQDGRIKLHLKAKKVDLRVSCIPCVWGEKIVMRILDQGNLKVDLKDLGFEPFVLETFMEGVKSPNGIVLVTGPTGSGKTTTLYSSLYLLNNPGVNIMTAEDPVEYNLMGVNQVQCHPDIGLTFTAALRSFLRQDPDVVMLGEIRDFETASIAIKAAMTGHVVISTLHTNDAPGTIARLLNMGIEPFSLSTALRVVEAQRLVRRICPVCSGQYKAAPDMVKSLGITEEVLCKLRLEDKIDINNIMLTKGSGCPECENTGLKGRQGIYEVLTVTPKFKEMIEASANTEEMRKQALEDGMLSLRESALYKLLSGVTSVEEVFRSTMSEKEGVNKKRKKKNFFPEDEQRLSQNISVAGISELTKEIHDFTEAMQEVTGGSQKAIEINSDLLKKNLSDPLSHIRNQASKSGDVSKVLPIIKAQGQKIDFNMNNMVSYFSNDTVVPAKMDLKALIEKEIFGKLKEHVVTARLISSKKTIGKGLKVSKNLPKELPMVKADKKAFTLIATNLVVNALIAVEGGGEIKIVARKKPKSNDRIQFIVFDAGPGISKENQKKLFTPFAPIGRSTLGLGLSVVKKLVEEMGGEISINSKNEAKTNTMVIVNFPIAT